MMGSEPEVAVALVVMVVEEEEEVLGGPEVGSSWSFDHRRDEISRVTSMLSELDSLQRSQQGGCS
jgi:hypothetical protein